MKHPIATLVLLAVLVVAPGCGDTARLSPVDPEPEHALLGAAAEARLDGTLEPPVAEAFDALATALEKEPRLEELVVAQPDDGATVVGAGDPPRFLWRDGAEDADTWWVYARFEKQSDADLQVLVPGGMPAEAALDPFSATLQAWTPSSDAWAHVVEHGAGTAVVVRFVGFAAKAPHVPLSKGSVKILVSGSR